MTTRSIFLGLLLFVPAAQAEQSERPNIVLMMAEDITNDLGVYGKEWLHTPHLDSLANKGARYTRFYTNGSTCSPSRTAMMTGVHHVTSGGIHQRSKVGDYPDFVRPFTHLLQEGGYTTVLGSNWISPAGRKIDINLAGKPWTNLFGFNDLEAALKEYPERPFFQQIQLALTHRSQSAKWPELRKKLKKSVKSEEIELPPFLPDVAEVREDEVLRLSAIEYIDTQVGTLVERYKRLGVYENTIFIFIGDNGQNQVRGKGYLYEPGILCPLIIQGPAPVPKASVINDLVDGVDLTATILQLAGVAVPAWMQGQAFLANADYERRSSVYTARGRLDKIPDCIRAVTRERYKYIRNFMPEVPWDSYLPYYEKYRPVIHVLRRLSKEGKLTEAQQRFLQPTKPKEELYDLLEDPHELNNLATSDEHREILKEMRAELLSYVEKTHDRGLKKTRSGEWVSSEKWYGKIEKPWLKNQK